MFHFDVTCEDCRLIATESLVNIRELKKREEAGQHERQLDVRLTDLQSGNVHIIHRVSFCDVEKLISGMICCHGDVPAADYPHLEKLLEDCPPECRPIP